MAMANPSDLSAPSWHSAARGGGHRLGTIVSERVEEEDDDEDFREEEEQEEEGHSESSGKTQKTTDSPYRGLAPEETRAVRRLRLLLIVVLLCVTILISGLVFWYVRNNEESEFQDDFEAQGTKLVSGFRDDSFQKMQALESLSASLTSYAQAANLTWPFVTVANSHEFLLPYLSLANAASIKIVPIVGARQRLAWEDHVQTHKDWVDQDLEKRLAEDERSVRNLQYFGQDDDEDNIVSRYIKNYVGVDTSPERWMPWWQYAPVIPNRWFLNFNELADAQFFREVDSVLAGKAVISKTRTFLPGLDFQSTKDFLFTQELLAAGGYGQYEPGEPIGFIHYPVFRDIDEASQDRDPVAVLSATVYWKTYFQDILPETSNGILCVVENDVQAFTYKINGKEAIFLGMDDLHDTQYDHLEISADYKSFETDTESGRYTGVSVDDVTASGAYKIRVYPSSQMQDDFTTNEPFLYASVVIAVMGMAISVFVLYDCYVERRQKTVSNVAVRNNAIVSSLFPAAIRDKLLNREEEKMESANPGKSLFHRNNPLMPHITSKLIGATNLINRDGEDPIKHPMKEIDDDELNPHGDSAPLADFFPSATVLFMDIAGFTAWSSAREPSQVFVLLETVYNSFDKLAKQRRVFKVETIGDCYVAVCGLPERCDAHAVVIAKFARDCLEKTDSLMHRLEPKLGPDTGDLKVRVGLHSGPVTAGVLRGDRARFQLFGDTVNTAARMESTSTPGRIQLSQECTELIIAGGKSEWVMKRSEVVQAKGKGEMQTFWLLPKRTLASSAYSATVDMKSDQGDDAIDWMSKSQQGNAGRHAVSHQESGFVLGNEPVSVDTEKMQRLVDYNSDILLSILEKIVAKHTAAATSGLFGIFNKKSPSSLTKLENETGKTGACLDEVAEIIELAHFDEAAYKKSAVKVPLIVATQLRYYCEAIARMYRPNPFHNFSHAAHVTQSTSKLLSRIVAVKEIGNMEAHDHTFGITSDPLTQFAVVFAALIHDVDHRGIPNPILAAEEPDLAELYKNQAIAEQNSVDVAWNLLMEPNFESLRRAIYHNESEMKRFRHLLVNCLMATDIFDKDLKALREKRWSNAFDEQNKEEDDETATNRKATIVIEHIIQASDVSHTMQHWHVYSKWNEKLYREMFKAYSQGRSQKDPTDGWYKGELWFFDNYAIPLARKLKECGVFGVSSDEYLNYAQANRKEWEQKGQGIVKVNFEKIKSELSSPSLARIKERKDRFSSTAMPTE